VSLFRNPAQTMDKLKSLITGLKEEASLGKIWAGAIQNKPYGLIPVYLPDLKDHTQRVLDIPFMNRIFNEGVVELPDDFNIISGNGEYNKKKLFIILILMTGKN
jgi:adenine-specific DNA-methyltransferase